MVCCSDLRVTLLVSTLGLRHKVSCSTSIYGHTCSSQQLSLRTSRLRQHWKSAGKVGKGLKLQSKHLLSISRSNCYMDELQSQKYGNVSRSNCYMDGATITKVVCTEATQVSELGPDVACACWSSPEVKLYYKA